MLSISIKGGKDQKEELLIDYDSGTLGFIVLTSDDKQVDFSIEKEEWNQLKVFIEQSISLEAKYKKDLEESL